MDTHDDGDDGDDVSGHVLSDNTIAEISAYFVLGTTLWIECCYFLHFVDH